MCQLEDYFAGAKAADYALARYSGTNSLWQALAARARCRIAGDRVADRLRAILDAWLNRPRLAWVPPIGPVPPGPDPSPWERLGASPQPEPPTIPDTVVAEALTAYAELLEGLATDFRSEAAARLSRRDAISPGERADAMLTASDAH
jgi:hypothetical protein